MTLGGRRQLLEREGMVLTEWITGHRHRLPMDVHRQVRKLRMTLGLDGRAQGHKPRLTGVLDGEVQVRKPRMIPVCGRAVARDRRQEYGLEESEIQVIERKGAVNGFQFVR